MSENGAAKNVKWYEMVGFITKYIYEGILVLEYITGSGTRRVFIKTRTCFGVFFF